MEHTMSFEEFEQLHSSPLRIVIRYFLYLLASPFILALAYLIAVGALGGIWWLSTLLDPSGALFPWSCVLLTFALTALAFEKRRKRKLYANYLGCDSARDAHEDVMRHSADRSSSAQV